MKTNQQMILVVLTALIAGGVGFFGGTAYQKNQSNIPNVMTRQGGSGFRMNQNNPGSNGSLGGTRNRFRPVSGKIISADDTSITVALDDGSSKIILVSKTVVINKAEEATISDLAVGETVSVFGTENTDGSITAQNIQLNPLNIAPPEASPPSPR